MIEVRTTYNSQARRRKRHTDKANSILVSSGIIDRQREREEKREKANECIVMSKTFIHHN